MKKYLTIHGHFYQPPRENPWTETIDRQPSAYPEHDWNEKINAECYYPNGFSRILDSGHRINGIVNNYSKISFNFGPTLLSWMELHAPDIYERILQADREGCENCDGHGPAIAQAYNHAILPLAPVEDQHVQIRWGIADFKRRFQREPESIWLPETAINQTTLNILTEYPFKYIILSPYQALRFRPLGSNEDNWNGVEDGSIDTRRAYRCFAKDEHGNMIPDRFIDIFFYHGELSRAISFENLLDDARHFASRVDQGFGAGDGPQQVSLATDGETYGHHKKFGDMALAYLLNVEAPEREITPINYGAFLDMHPPQFEVEIKPGPNGEGTAWSCAHGVGRWYRDCGCHTGGELSWDQSWRQPLRTALDNLRDELRKLTHALGQPLLKDFNAARDNYIHVILDRTEATVAEFFARHAAHELSEDERRQVMAVMEIERQLQLMYTSCGWFFSEISGIETVQIIKYAARAIQIAEFTTDRNFEDRFLNDLQQAKSNLPAHKNGEWIYLHFVKPLVVPLDQVVSHFAISTALRVIKSDKVAHSIYIYEVEQQDYHQSESDDQKLQIGKVRVRSRATLREETFGYALIHYDTVEKVKCATRSMRNGWDYETSKNKMLQAFGSDHNDLESMLSSVWGGQQFSVRDLFYEERQKVADQIIKRQMRTVSMCAEEIYEQSQGIIITLSDLGLPLPDEIAQPARMTLSNVILGEVARLRNETDMALFEKAIEAARTAQKLDIKLNTEKAAQIFQKMIIRRLRRLKEHFDYKHVKPFAELVELANRMNLKLHLTPIQNQVYSILQQQLAPAIEHVIQQPEDDTLYKAVNALLQTAYSLNFNIQPYKESLESIEKPMADDPANWP